MAEGKGSDKMKIALGEGLTYSFKEQLSKLVNDAWHALREGSPKLFREKLEALLHLLPEEQREWIKQSFDLETEGKEAFFAFLEEIRRLGWITNYKVVKCYAWEGQPVYEIVALHDESDELFF